MYKKIISVIVSRTDYLKSLYAILQRHYHEYDECHIWLNTDKDVEIYKNTFLPNNKIVIKEEIFDPLATGIMNLNKFYKKYAIDDNSIYIKIDDDVVWFEKDFFSKMFSYRILNKNNFLIYPLIINNAIITNILMRLGKLDWDPSCWYQPMDPVGWGSGIFAEQLHNKFLEMVANQEDEKLKFEKWILDWKELVNINTVCFFGSDMKLVAPTLEFHADEAYFCHYGPSILHKQNIICGQFICAHYAFQPQKKYLDTTDILTRYEKLV